MRYFSMFSGIGGFELGIKRATEGGWECIGFSEIDKYSIQNYNKHFKHKNYGDAKHIDWNTVPNFDMLCGGFPCQAFSVAGRRKGFDDTRGTLFFEICKGIENKKPQYIFLENVKGLCNHEQGNTFRTILRNLDELGYDVEWQILNSKYFGVPQNRERVFIIGHFRGTSGPKVFPIEESNKKDYELQGQQDTTCTIKARHEADSNGSYVVECEQLPQNKIKQLGNLYESPHNSVAGRFYDADGISPTIKGEGGGLGGKCPLIEKETKIRRLTPTECERLQGFPDRWTEGVSDSQRYKQLGNAVTVNVIEAIVRQWQKLT